MNWKYIHQINKYGQAIGWQDWNNMGKPESKYRKDQAFYVEVAFMQAVFLGIKDLKQVVINAKNT